MAKAIQCLRPGGDPLQVVGPLEHSDVDSDVLHDLPSEQFDVAIMSNVLEHLEHRIKFLREVQARLMPGRWLIRVPLFERHWSVPLKQELGMDYRLDPTHQIEYTQESFAGEMRQAGLEIVHQEVRWGEIWAEVRRREGV